MPKDYFFFIWLLLIISYPKKKSLIRTIKLSKRWKKLHLDTREKKHFNFWPCELGGGEKSKDTEDALLTSQWLLLHCAFDKYSVSPKYFRLHEMFNLITTPSHCSTWGQCNRNKKFYLILELFLDAISSNLTTCITEVWINSRNTPFPSQYSMLF